MPEMLPYQVDTFAQSVPRRRVPIDVQRRVLILQDHVRKIEKLVKLVVEERNQKKNELKRKFHDADVSTQGTTEKKSKVGRNKPKKVARKRSDKKKCQKETTLPAFPPVSMGTEMIDDEEADDEVDFFFKSGGPPIVGVINGQLCQYVMPPKVIPQQYTTAAGHSHIDIACSSRLVNEPTFIDEVSGHCMKYGPPRKFTTEPSQFVQKVPCMRPPSGSLLQDFQPIQT